MLAENPAVSVFPGPDSRALPEPVGELARHAPVVGRPDLGARRLAGLLAAAMLLACLCIDQLHALLGYSRLATDEDQTLLWLAGRQLLHLSPHQPNFYGQNYNTVFEALPGEVLHLLGVSFALAIPLGTTVIASACWVALAWAARRRGDFVSAAAALALPVCLSVPYMLLLDAPRGVLSGDLLGACAVAMSIASRRPGRRLGVLIALGGLAIAWDNAIAIAVLPALAASTMGDIRSHLERPARTLASICGAAVVPAGWLLFAHFWYRAHPDQLIFPGVDTSLQLSVLAHNLAHPGALFAFYVPQLWQTQAVVLVALGSLIVAALAIGLAVRRPGPVAAAVAFLLVLVVTLSVRDTLNVRPDLYLAGSRFLLTMPFGAWVVFHYGAAGAASAARRGWAGPRAALLARCAVLVIVAVALVSAGAAQTRFSSAVRAVSAVDDGPHYVIGVSNPQLLLAECGVIARTYRATGAELLVTDERSVAYGCAAQSAISTIVERFGHPAARYDRRAWMLDVGRTRAVTRLLIQDRSCRSFPASVGTCRAAAAGMVLLVTPPRPLDATLRLAESPQ